MPDPRRPPDADAETRSDSGVFQTPPFQPADAPLNQDLGLTPGEIVVRRYRIVSLLGRGGMGEVYRADDLRLGHPVALKFLSAPVSRDGAHLQRFVREVRLARQISHPNVCRVYDMAQMGERYFLSMEYIDGEDLASLLRRVGRLPIDKALDVTHQICAALAAAHDKGVLHLDLKPANIMVDGRGRALITDFGIALSRLDRDALLAGTPPYMSPEQLLGREVTVQTDLYALGLVMYEAFTGRRAITARTLDERLRSVVPPEPARPSDLVRDLDPSVDRIILECLAADSHSRPASAMDVSAALPGDNPIATALAAGRLPSPEMVAASRDEQIPPPALAWTLFVAFVGAVALFASLNDGALHRLRLDTPPAVLVAAARRFAHDAVGGTAVDSAYWFTRQRSYQQQALHLDPTFQIWATHRQRQLGDLRFVYRESPRPLTAGNVFGVVLYRDPPADVPGMADVNLDLNGRLLRLVVVPDLRIPSTEPSVAVDWREWLERAGLAAGSLTQVPPLWMPPVPSDSRVAWEGQHPDPERGRIHVTAASLHGQPVYFDVLEDKDLDSSALPPAWEGEGIAHDAPWRVFLVLTVLAFAVLLARWHVIRGQGDRRGALRLACFMLCLSGVGSVRADHVSDIGNEFFLLAKLAGWSLYVAVFVATLYLAFEPFVRRRWPMMLIGWTRLLSGQIWDSVVGRDVLIGCVFGAAMVATGWLAFVVVGTAVGLSAVPPFDLAADALREPRHVVALVVFLMANALGVAMGGLLLLRVAHMAVRVTWVAVVAWLLIVMPSVIYPAADVRLALAAAVANSVLAVLVIYRFGLLAFAVALFVADLLMRLPVSLDMSTWYAGRSFFVMSVLGGLALYGLRATIKGEMPIAHRTPDVRAHRRAS